MARNIANAKRSNKPNPREERNTPEYRRKRDNIVNFDEAASKSYRRKKVELLPRNLAQENYLDSLNDDSKDIVFGVGPAGTGKSYLATLKAIEMFQNGEIEKIIIARPLVSVGDDIGFLPGSLMEKMAPWCVPILDIFKEYYSVQTVEKMLLNEELELGNIGMCRGRTIKNSVLLFDEAQNATVEQMKMMLTRIGEGTRIFVNGDLNQTDRLNHNAANGFKDFIDRLEKSSSKKIDICRFAVKDVERHAVVEEVLKIYGDI